MAAESTVQGVSVCVSVGGYTQVCVGMYVSVVSVNTSVCACMCEGMGRERDIRLPTILSSKRSWISSSRSGHLQESQPPQAAPTCQNHEQG